MNVVTATIRWVPVLVYLLAGAVSLHADATPVLSESFDGDETGELRTVLEKHPLLKVVDGEGVNGGAALRAQYKGYAQGSRRIVVMHPLGASGKEFTLNYDVRFDEDFQFTHGGKLHGLAPAERAAGGSDVGPTQWSARVNFAREGGIRSYVYHQRLPGTYGQGKSGGEFRFRPGEYHAVSLHIRLNDPAEEDNGFVRIYVDGERRVEHTDIQFRGSDAPESLITDLHFSTFHGGSAPRWAPVDEEGEYTSVYAYFDNFTVYPGERIRPEPDQ